MLVLGTTPQEMIVLKWADQTIEIQLVRDGRGKTRIGIHAPQHISITRQPRPRNPTPHKTGTPHRTTEMGPKHNFKRGERSPV